MTTRTSRAFALVLAAALTAGGLAVLGCQQKPAPPQPTVEPAADSPSQGELTRQMEETAAAAVRQLEEAQRKTASEEDAIKAYEEFERQRRELNQMAEPPAEPPPQ